MCMRMRGITPARPQFETRPLLLDVIEVPRPLNETGLYSREASIRGNTVYESGLYCLILSGTFLSIALIASSRFFFVS